MVSDKNVKELQAGTGGQAGGEAQTVGVVSGCQYGCCAHWQVHRHVYSRNPRRLNL